MRKFAWLLLVAAMLVLAVTPALAQDRTTHIRVGHFSPDTPAVEIYVNGQLSGIQVLSVGDISGWVELPAGTYSVAVAPAGAGLDAAAIGPVSLNFSGGGWVTIAATGSLSGGTLGADVIAENLSPLASGESQVTVFHGIEDAPAVDVILPDGTALVSNLRFGQGRSLTVPAGTYDLAVVAAGTTGPAVINLSGTTLNSQTTYFVAAINRLEAPQVALSAVTQGQLAPLFGQQSIPTRSIAEIAVNDGRFSTLVTALDTAGLVDTLAGEGSFTVFAPTNAAFAKIPSETLNAVLADQETLTTILLYHVVGGKALASDVVAQSSLNMLAGGSVTVELRDGGVYLNGDTQIILTDIAATNGVIHVIDTVLLP